MWLSRFKFEFLAIQGSPPKVRSCTHSPGWTRRTARQDFSMLFSAVEKKGQRRDRKQRAQATLPGQGSFLADLVMPPCLWILSFILLSMFFLQASVQTAKAVVNAFDNSINPRSLGTTLHFGHSGWVSDLCGHPH